MAADDQGADPLAERLEDAQLELQRLQELVADVPELMEARFRQELRQIAAVNQSLLAERQQLLAQLQAPGPAAAAVLPPAPRAPQAPQAAGASRQRPRRPWRLALTVRQRRSGLVAVVAMALLAVGWLLRGSLAALVPAGLLPGFLPGAAPPAPPDVPAAPNPVLPVAGTDQSVVELDASEPTWVEVTDRSGELLLKDTLDPGNQRRIRLRSGLRLFVARPEMLRYRVDEGPWQPWPQALQGTGQIELVPTGP